MKRCRFYRAAKMEAGASSRASGSYRLRAGLGFLYHRPGSLNEVPMVHAKTSKVKSCAPRVSKMAHLAPKHFYHAFILLRDRYIRSWRLQANVKTPCFV